MKELWYAIVEELNNLNVLETWCGNSNTAWGRAEEIEQHLKEQGNNIKLTVLGGWDNRYQMNEWFEKKQNR